MIEPGTFYIDATEDELNALVAGRMRYRRLIGLLPVEDYDDALELQQDRRDYPQWYNTKQHDLDDCTSLIADSLAEYEDLPNLTRDRIFSFCASIWGDDNYVVATRECP